jgi:DNA (cytosine-5)-methyltransferase 1
VEIDDYCRRVLAKHWPDVPKFGDIRTVTGGELEWVDLICGGFPCQPVSIAGLRLGRDDERWMWPEYARIVRLVRPRLVLVENVPGLLGRGMGDVLGDLAALGYGLWPTPQAHDATKGYAHRVGRYGTKHGARNLNDWAAKWPTPRNCTAMAARITPEAVAKAPARFPNLETVVALREPSAAGGYLNPLWVEWLMGFPPTWTEVD